MTRRMTKKDFVAVWKPTIETECVSSDPWKYRATATMDYYGRTIKMTRFHESRSVAAGLVVTDLFGEIVGM